MSHLATNPNFVDNGEGRCRHCGKTATEHDMEAAVTACLGQDYIESLNEWERAQFDKALTWQRAGKGRVVAYLEAGAALPAATLERYRVVNAGGSRGQYAYLEPRGPVQP